MPGKQGESYGLAGRGVEPEVGLGGWAFDDVGGGGVGIVLRRGGKIAGREVRRAGDKTVGCNPVLGGGLQVGGDVQVPRSPILGVEDAVAQGGFAAVMGEAGQRLANV